MKEIFTPVWRTERFIVPPGSTDLAAAFKVVMA